jgi:hypothetical protein
MVYPEFVYVLNYLKYKHSYFNIVLFLFIGSLPYSVVYVQAFSAIFLWHYVAQICL